MELDNETSGTDRIQVAKEHQFMVQIFFFWNAKKNINHFNFTANIIYDSDNLTWLQDWKSCGTSTNNLSGMGGWIYRQKGEEQETLSKVWLSWRDMIPHTVG